MIGVAIFEDGGIKKAEMAVAYLTRFWVHSRSCLVSLAALMPSAKLARAFLSRRWASAWSSRSSCCLELRWPEL